MHYMHVKHNDLLKHFTHLHKLVPSTHQEFLPFLLRDLETYLVREGSIVASIQYAES